MARILRFLLAASIVCLLFLRQEAFARGYGHVIPVPAEVKVSDGLYRFLEMPEIHFKRVSADVIGHEGYKMKITPRGVFVRTSSAAGEFYALQTLRQMTADGKCKELRCCEITDYPRFPYRGLHFDVSRHFRSIEFLKKQIDAMAMFKMNRMHIHLTDAAGWRFESDAYPLLTKIGAWRAGDTWNEWVAGGCRYAEEGADGAYGGYYTKEQMRDLVAYARDRHIEIIPEIEMPGHSEEVLAAYPELGCSGEAYKDSDFCVGSEDVFRFLETVLAEVMEVFPSGYIHIGGDEAGKQHWKTCPKCQERMRKEGLADVDGLQSYMIGRIERFVNSKGRRIIGWDEILEGGLAPDATVMSWRGTEGGIEAMLQGHDVIMTPGRYCYLDHAQDAPFKEPESIGGYLPLDSVYVYEPLPEDIPEDQKVHLIGVQANLWAEYIPTDSHAEYMYWPRAFAIAETAWSPAEKKNLKDFRERAAYALELLRGMGYETFDLNSEYGERKQAQTGIEHKAKGCKVSYSTPIQERYPAAGETTFTDGIIGGWTYSDRRWQGFLSDIDVTIDLGRIQNISYIGGTFMQLAGPGVFMPEKVDILVSEDGKNFRLAATVWNDVSVKNTDLLFRSFDTVLDEDIRYVRYHAYRSTMKGFLFLDEIVVN